MAIGVHDVPLKRSIVGAGDDASARRMMYTGFDGDSGSSWVPDALTAVIR